MQKQDLKEGMLIVYRNGKLRKIHKEYDSDELLMSNPIDCSWNTLNNYKDDLTESEEERLLDIIAVYAPTRHAKFFSFDLKDYELVWKLEEPALELTLEEISKKYGVKTVKIVEKGRI